jgi:glycosyltransferase involved in cell wall biosynthesis/tetratricopeptide (TPR) repeat protein
MIEAFTQVRKQVLELCDQQKFSTARLFLIGSGCQVDTHTSLWEYVARRSDVHGNSAVARTIRKELWDANVGSSDLALREADAALEKEEFEAAEFILETTFGGDPENHEALRRFAMLYYRQAERVAEGARLHTDRGRALKLAANFSFKEPADATVLVDLLRYSGEFALALEKNAIARQQFGDHVKFISREARICEQMYDLARAVELWEEVAEKSEGMRGAALLKLCLLYQRLERGNDLMVARARLAIADVSVADRLRLALSAGQAGMAHALSEYVGLGGPGSDKMPAAVSVSFTEQLLDSGEIGLAVWLRRQRVPVGDRVKRVLDAIGFSIGGSRELPDTVPEAITIKSPDFMLPLEKTLKLRPKPRGWPGVGRDPKRILLVNVTLGIGGAERQFVELARALLENGVRKDQLHVAVFSLNVDRGHAHFLPDLEALGIQIHQLAERSVLNPHLTLHELNMIEVLPKNLRDDVRLLLPLVNELQPDVLHGWQDRSSAVCSVVGTAASVNRIVLSARNMSPVTRRDKELVLNEALFREMISKDNVMVSANSRLAAEDYAKWLGCNQDRIDVIPNAVDMSRYPVLPKDPIAPEPVGPLRIGGVRLAINKRPLLWLRTIHALRHEQGIDLQPFLFGSGPLAREVEIEAEKLGLTDLVLRSGVVDPMALYGDLDVLLLMSQVEGLPNVLLEAQAMGKPVIACDVGGTREAVKRAGKGAGLILDAQVTPSEAAAQIAGWLPNARSTPPYLIQRHIRNVFDPKLLAFRTLESYRGHKGAKI